MALFGRKKKEERADDTGTVGFDDALLKALMGGGEATKEIALQIPTVSGGIDLIANIVASTPVKLYSDESGKAQEVKGDIRTFLLNDETGDTLNANEFWHAIIRDYYVGKGGYAYLKRKAGKIKSVHYVDEREISILKNTDPIFKDFDIQVQGVRYKPYEFFRLLRNTKDGAQGIPITAENSNVIQTAFQQLMLEQTMARRGGKKKGFLQTENKVDGEALTELKAAWRDLYKDDGDGTIILNKGLKFQEASDTAAEMQLVESKNANAAEFAKIFHVSTSAIAGSSADIGALAKLAAIPLMNAIQCALNRDFLLESEKGKMYFAFDTKELLKGEMGERFAAYKTALDANFMQIDEVRYAEDLEPLGLQWIKLGLNDVLYDPKSKQIYTPNTNQTAQMGAATVPTAGSNEPAAEAEPQPSEEEPANEDKDLLQPEDRADIIEPRGGNFIQDPETGRMMGSEPGGGSSSGEGGKQGSGSLLDKDNLDKYMEPQKNHYAKSARKNSSGKTLPPKTYARLCGQLGTKYPNSEKGTQYRLRSGSRTYVVRADGDGGFALDYVY